MVRFLQKSKIISYLNKIRLEGPMNNYGILMEFNKEWTVIFIGLTDYSNKHILDLILRPNN